jgi:hypothetical protein
VGSVVSEEGESEIDREEKRDWSTSFDGCAS